jgi:hypothetical protein
MVTQQTRHHRQAFITPSIAAGLGPWPALDAFRATGGRIRWNKWFRLWSQADG